MRDRTKDFSSSEHETNGAKEGALGNAVAENGGANLQDPSVITAPPGDQTIISTFDREDLLLKIERLQQQLKKERMARASLEHRLAREVAFTEKRIKAHLSYRLGREIIASGRSPIAWLRLPSRLIRTYGDFKRRMSEQAQPRAKPASRELVAIYEAGGAPAVVGHLSKGQRSLTQAELAWEAVRAGQALARAGVEGAEMTLSAEAVQVDPSPRILRARFWACHRSADYASANEVAERLWKIAGEQDLHPDERKKLEPVFRHPVRQLAILDLVRDTPDHVIEPVQRRVCYVLHNSLPHSSGGYATRSHGLASALKHSGWDVVAVTRPGFPFDVTSDLTMDQVSREDRVDGIKYVRLFEPSRRELAPAQYISLAADAIEGELRRQRPEVVVAASNHLTGLPTLIAARRLGIPFFYEVRGLWEITRMSREPGFAKNINFWIQKSLEAAVSSHASGVFTLTYAMREELQNRGVPGEKITLLPNSCNAELFSPRDKDQVLQEQLGIPHDVPVIGYIGTFVGYEGLDDLAQAAGLLRRRGVHFRLLLVGNEDASGKGRGEITQAIEKCARQEGFLDWLIMPGRVPHELVPSYYSLIDITPFPRKPLPVCEMVSPIKPLEALAMEKAVVVSNVRALAEMIRDEETGVHFQKGEVTDLADKLQRLLGDTEYRQRLGQEGRRWVQAERSWSAAAQQMQKAITDSIDYHAM